MKTSNNEDKKQLAIQLRAWVGQQRERRTWKQWADFFGIKEKTLGGYIQGKTFPRGDNLKRLQAKASLPILRHQNESEIERKMTSEQYARRVENILQQLAKELNYFKSGKREDREVFRKIVMGEDVGYIISLLKALFDEDTFQNWIFAAQYKFNRRKNDSEKLVLDGSR